MDARGSSGAVAVVWPFAVAATSVALLFRWHVLGLAESWSFADELTASLGEVRLALLLASFALALALGAHNLKRVFDDDAPLVLPALPLIVPGLVGLIALHAELVSFFAPRTHCGPAAWEDIVTMQVASSQWVRALTLSFAGAGFLWLTVVAAARVRRQEFVAGLGIMFGLLGVGVSLLASARASVHLRDFLFSAASRSTQWDSGALERWAETTRTANSTLLFAVVLFVAASLHDLKWRASLRRVIGLASFAVAMVGVRGGAAATDRLIAHHIEENAPYVFGTGADTRATPAAIVERVADLTHDPLGQLRRPLSLRLEPDDAAGLAQSARLIAALGEPTFVVTLAPTFVAPSRELRVAELLTARRAPFVLAEVGTKCERVVEWRHGQVEIVDEDRVPQADLPMFEYDPPCAETNWKGRSPAAVLAEVDAARGRGYRIILSVDAP